MTYYSYIYLPEADFDRILEEWSKIGPIKYSKLWALYYFEGLDCSVVHPLLEDLVVVFTRDRYLLPPKAWTIGGPKGC